MKSVDLHQVDAFTKALFGGNPAGVVTNADGLSDQDMQHIAREMNLSETAFVSRSNQGADFRLRWFTPSSEVDFCGHATIGALFELARLRLNGLGAPGLSKVKVETMSGLLEMCSEVKDGRISATFSAPKPEMHDYRLQGKEFADKLGIPSEVLVPGGKVLINTALKDIFAPVVSADALDKLSFDFARIKAEFASERIVAFGLFAKEGDGLQVRGLAPLVGVDEDPFTGRLQAALMLSARSCGFIPEAQTELRTSQGRVVGRPGEALVMVDKVTGETKVTGSAVHVFSTRLTLP